MKEVNGEFVLVDAVISSERVFQVPKEKVGKFVVGKTDETKHFESKKTEELFEGAFNKILSRFNIKNPLNDLAVEQKESLESQAIGSKKRKSTEANISENEEEDDDEEIDDEDLISIL
jgi:hypothetical protein